MHIVSGQVVAADLSSDGGRDVVMYKIRVADARGEWTVSRRFRHFEGLHRNLRDVAAYRIKLPGKRIFAHGQSVEFVEERRQGLDNYLQQVLADARLAGAMRDVVCGMGIPLPPLFLEGKRRE